MENKKNPEQIADIRRRVQAAFGDLGKIGFIARRNFSCCSSCATYELGEIAGKRHRNRAVYFHRQDEEHFRKTGMLYIRFCYLPPKNIQGETLLIEKQIGDQVAAALQKQGLELDWNGNPNVTIRITGVLSNGKENANGTNTTTL